MAEVGISTLGSIMMARSKANPMNAQELDLVAHAGVSLEAWFTPLSVSSLAHRTIMEVARHIVNRTRDLLWLSSHYRTLHNLRQRIEPIPCNSVACRFTRSAIIYTRGILCDRSRDFQDDTKRDTDGESTTLRGSVLSQSGQRSEPVARLHRYNHDVLSVRSNCS